MITISEETKKTFQDRYPEFEDACQAFFRQELPAGQYKGISGKYGSYAERGGKSGMLRMRFSGGRVTKDQIAFLARAIDTYHVQLAHFTTAQAIQYHKMDGPSILSLYKECLDHGIYCIGGGGDNPRNITASPLRGVDPKEFFDVSPYVDAAASFILTLIPELHLPRKYKIAFSNGTDNESHATFKDLGFLAKKNGTFDVYAAGGLGAANPRLGVKVGEDVAPTKILYYIDAFAQMFMAHGDYKNRARARSRFMPVNLGDEEFCKTFQTFLKQSQEKDLSFIPQEYVVAKKAPSSAKPNIARIHSQKQDNLYYVEYHPLGGTPDMAVFKKALQFLSDVEDAELRLNTDESLYAVNLTAEEAIAFAAITEEDTAKNTFEKSVCCIGAAICQQGLRDSHGMWLRTVKALRGSGVDTSYLPKLHISGCPSSCAAQQIGAIGLRGAAKKVDGDMKPAFTVFAGGTYATPTQERFGAQIGVITEDNIPALLTALAETLKTKGQTFDEWYGAHTDEFASLVSSFE